MIEAFVQLRSEDVRSRMTRIDTSVSASEGINHQLQETVFGQPEATRAVARRLNLLNSGLSAHDKPLGSMFFLGPAGVGKTEMAHAAAKVMFNDPDSSRLRILNMSEFSEDHTITKLVGAPPSYVGWNETPAIPHNWLHGGRSIIVFDEIDKAAPKVKQALLSIMDKGKLDARNASKGAEELDFTNALVIFTANVAGHEIAQITEGRRGIGFRGAEPTQSDKHRRIQGEAEKGMRLAFSPEFVNRLDDIVVFEPLTDPLLYDRMITKFLDQKNHQLLEDYQTVITDPQGMMVKDVHGQVMYSSQAPYFAVTQEFRQMILPLVVGKGGRELRRKLDSLLFDPAADVFQSIDVRRRPIVADVEDGKVVFYTDVQREEDPLPEVLFEEKKTQLPPKAPTTHKEKGTQKVVLLGLLGITLYMVLKKRTATLRKEENE